MKMKFTVFWSVTSFSVICRFLLRWYTSSKVHGVTFRKAVVLLMINFNTRDE